MEIVYLNDLNDIKNYGELAIAHGFFDGIHFGHQLLVKRAVKYAKEHGLKAGVVTFNKKFVDTNCDKERYIKQLRISSIERKAELLSHFGIDIMFVINFEIFRDYSAQEYINKIIAPIGTKYFVIGKDNRFGKNGMGSSENVVELAHGMFDVEIADLVNENNIKISTSSIKEEILNGNIVICEEKILLEAWK